MRTNDNDYNYFDDPELWDNSAAPRESTRQAVSFRSCDDDLENFFDEYPEPENRHTGSSRSRRRSQKKKFTPALLAAAVLAIVLLINHVSGNGGTETPSSPTDMPEYQMQTAPAVVPTEETPPLPTSPAPTTPPAVTPLEYRYFCKMLTPEQQKIYEIIRDGISRREDNIGPFNVKNGDELDLILQSVYYDWPEYFWFRGGHYSSYYDMGTHLEYTLSPSYAFSSQEYLAHAAFVEAQTQDIINELSGKSDYEKVKGVYEYLIDRTIYDLGYTGTTIYELFHDGRAVCEGYARASQYLLTKLGIEILYASGDAGKYGQPVSQWGGHAWNIVKIDGIYYGLDTTWGDPVSDDGIQYKSFNYLNLTDEEMERRHKRDNWRSYPACTEHLHNYYYMEGRYLEFFSKDVITAWFQESYYNNEPLTFKCANEAVYQHAYNWFYSEGGIDELFRSVLPEGSGYSYSYGHTDELYILTLESA